MSRRDGDSPSRATVGAVAQLVADFGHQLPPLAPAASAGQGRRPVHA